MTIFDISDLVGKPFPRAIIPTNILDDFKAIGFYPLNKKKIFDVDILPVNFSDRLLTQKLCGTQPDRLLPEKSSALSHN